MSWNTIIQDLGLSQVPARWLTQPLSDSSNFIECFTLEQLELFISKTAAPDDVAEALRDGYQMVGNHPSLALLFVHCHHVYFGGSGDMTGLGQCPLFDLNHNKNIKHINTFWALLLISGINRLLENHSKLGIDESITYATASDIYPWMVDYHQDHGQWGFHKIGWLSMHYASRLFTLGRLQFEPMTWQRPELVLYSEKQNKYVMLAPDTAVFRKDGQYNGANQIVDPDAWISRWSNTDQQYKGHVIDHRGKASQDAQTFSKSEWQVAIEHGNDLLSVHIPASGPMDYHECGKSCEQALSFFASTFPEKSIKGFYCHSWLMDWQLTQYLRDSSNIAKFLKEWYLVPCRNTNASQTIERVFGNDRIDLGAVEPKSSLQKAVLDHIASGGQWRSPEGFMFARGFNWGSQPY